MCPLCLSTAVWVAFGGSGAALAAMAAMWRGGAQKETNDDRSSDRHP